MNYRMMSRFISLILLVEVIFMLPALALALWDHNMVVALAFLEGMGANSSGLRDSSCVQP